jgi:hypothetical protein
MIFFRSEFHDFRRLRKSIVSIRGMLQMAAEQTDRWIDTYLYYPILYSTVLYHRKKKETMQSRNKKLLNEKHKFTKIFQQGD